MRIIILLLILFCFPFSFLLSQVESQYFLEGAAVTDIKRDGSYLWVSTYGQGIYRYSLNEGKWINFSSQTGDLDNDLFYAVDVSNDYIWGAAAEGLFTFDKNKQKWSVRKFAEGGQFGNWIRSLNYNQQDSILWIGRFRNITIFDVKRKRYSHHNAAIGSDQKSNNIQVIKFDGDSLIWFGAESGLHIYSRNKNFNSNSAWRYLTNKNRGFSEKGDAVSVSDILFENSGVWIGTDEFVTATQPEFNIGGIFIYDRRLNWQRISKIDGLGGNGIFCLERTGNYIWVGVYDFDPVEKKQYGKGLFLINRLTKEISEVDLNLVKVKSASILSLHFDGINMWVGTSEGLVRIRISNPLAHW